jgi:2-polyprenyl-3-methyl-5-hydroxy-6-metoxy-1,4-benzoquinol methylase
MMSGVSSQSLQERIDAFPVWHYQFEFDGGVKTRIYRPDYVNRHIQRRRTFFDPLVAVNGGSLNGRRVLDLGCNAGYWSLAAIEAGADFVLGIDGRQMHVDQAKLVFGAKGVDPACYRFETGNIFDHDFGGEYDVVLCLGFMYHIAKHVELFEIMASVDPEFILIDTTVSLMPTSAFVVDWDSLDNPRDAIDYELVLIPTRHAVLDLAKQFGFNCVALAPNITDYTGMDDYRTMQRASFICSRTVSLDRLASERMGTMTLLGAAARKRANRERRRFQKLLSRR